MARLLKLPLMFPIVTTLAARGAPLFDRLRRIFSRANPPPPVVKDDPDFGRISFDRAHDWWCGEVVIGEKTVPLFVHAPFQGPSSRQRELWRGYVSNLATISQTVIRDFVDRVNEHIPHRKDVLPHEFDLDEVEVAPDEWADRVDAILTYSLEGDDDGSWRFELLDGRAVSSGRDD